MKKFLLCILILILIVANVWVIYLNQLKAVGTSKEEIEFIVEENETYISLASKLKEKNLIKSELAYKIYLKLNPLNNLEAGKYYLRDNMTVEEIVKTLGTKSNFNGTTVKITFKEGKNVRAFAKLIAENTDNSEEEFFALLKDESYLDELIEKYWFLTDDIKNKDLYYSLEGYLFPDTYEVLKNDSIKTIIEKVLDNMQRKLEPYREDIEASTYSVHQLITLASIIELEEAHSSARKDVAGVFYNRIKSGWALGSDVTTIYAEKRDDWSQPLTIKELNSCNKYNTRSNCFTGLPVGPVGNPGLSSLDAVFEPSVHDNYYFVDDCNGKNYLNKTLAGHEKTIADLQKAGLWCVN